MRTARAGWVGLACALAVVACQGRVAADEIVGGPWVHARSTVVFLQEEDEDAAVAEALVSASALAWAPWRDSVAAARGSILDSDYGEGKTYCDLTAHDPYSPEDPPDNFIEGGADVETLKPFILKSDTLPDGTAVSCHVDVSYQGCIQAFEHAAGLSTSAHASALIQFADEPIVISDDDDGDDATLLEEREGFVEVTGTPDGQTTEETGDWVGCLSASAVEGGYDLDYNDTFDFDAVVGQRFWFYFDLATGVWMSGGEVTEQNCDQGYAMADFWNTGTYQFSTDNPEARFELLPEPATLSLLGLGALALLRRRKRSA